MIPLRTIAYHEAGHAAAHLHLSRPIKKITIVSEGNADGHVEFARNRQLVHGINIGIRSPTALLRMQQEIVCLFAGQLALRRLGVRRWKVGAEQDCHDAGDLASRVCGAGETRSTRIFLKWCWVQSERLIERDDVWTLVEALAQRLLQQHVLSAKGASRVFQEVRDQQYQDLLRAQGRSPAEIKSIVEGQRQLAVRLHTRR